VSLTTLTFLTLGPNPLKSLGFLGENPGEKGERAPKIQQYQ
jgi:hypothetical protein